MERIFPVALLSSGLSVNKTIRQDGLLPLLPSTGLLLPARRRCSPGLRRARRNSASAYLGRKSCRRRVSPLGGDGSLRLSLARFFVARPDQPRRGRTCSVRYESHVRLDSVARLR